MPRLLHDIGKIAIKDKILYKQGKLDEDEDGRNGGTHFDIYFKHVFKGDQMNKNILFVDDEKQILKAIKRLFLGSDYNVFLAESGEQALEVLDKEDISVIITDMRMPNMDGYQLLKKVKEKHPLVFRLILSGYADENIVFKALRENLAKSYLFKPWDNQNLLEVIEQVFESVEMINNKKLLTLLNNIEEFPPLASSYNKLCSLIEKGAEIDKIAMVIEEDQAIAVKVLQIANSTYYGLRTGSVKQAISHLGLTNLRNLILTTTAFEDLNEKGNFVSNKKLLWEHACLCNKIVTILYEKIICEKLPDIYSSAGLLHDMGTIVLLYNYRGKYADILNKTINEGAISLINMEIQTFSASHQEIGGYLLNWWGLPQPIVESALFHHLPLDGRVKNKELVSIVHIADILSWKILGIDMSKTLDNNIFDLLGVSSDDCKKIVTEYKLI
ncbi:MAG: HDOD domain-containing protein [Firmicutes bacterium]|nr:HDOD domain-containing protein [Bacillota bacterium]